MIYAFCYLLPRMLKKNAFGLQMIDVDNVCKVCTWEMEEACKLNDIS